MRSVFGKSYKIEVKERRWRRDGSTETTSLVVVEAKAIPKLLQKVRPELFFLLPFSLSAFLHISPPSLGR